MGVAAAREAASLAIGAVVVERWSSGPERMEVP